MLTRIRLLSALRRRLGCLRSSENLSVKSTDKKRRIKFGSSNRFLREIFILTVCGLSFRHYCLSSRQVQILANNVDLLLHMDVHRRWMIQTDTGCWMHNIIEQTHVLLVPNYEIKLGRSTFVKTSTAADLLHSAHIDQRTIRHTYNKISPISTLRGLSFRHYCLSSR